MSKPTIHVLALGGTIAMTPGDSGGVVPTLTGEGLVAAVPQLEQMARIKARSFRQLPSAHLGYGDLEALAALIRSEAQDACRGVVITQGTDTIEETAFVLDRLLSDLDLPVVVTGAMRNPSLPGADGPGNLLAAVQVALSEAARGCGCLVVMNDEVHAARFVRKVHTSRLDAFQSPASGRLGWVVEDRVALVLRPPRVAVVPPAAGVREARVGLVKVALGDDGRLVEALLAAQPDALVVEATGGGHVTPEMAQVLGTAARTLPVILASRTGAGETLAHTYGYPGAEIDLQQRGLIRSGWLDGLKARVLATLLMRHGVREAEAIRAAFRPWGGG